ncbi:GLE1-domain-containing protein [Gonapodya prolifera JEL478]|uniref:mRNA export factor GLE1 n=1 Tax=Gonapodya prolifera (strain JEL478) TaxID=1344416 RepID=A0A139AXI6_GONPJ|nr:GLE1-domain-containing protein [Gonapodya prolifera JEL478]|eukprot:KXS21456.1 GLE1-domain-containing protein [Gonapodya prolifera JEL478]
MPPFLSPTSLELFSRERERGAEARGALPSGVGSAVSPTTPKKDSRLSQSPRNPKLPPTHFPSVAPPPSSPNALPQNQLTKWQDPMQLLSTEVETAAQTAATATRLALSSPRRKSPQASSVSKLSPFQVHLRKQEEEGATASSIEARTASRLKDTQTKLESRDRELEQTVHETFRRALELANAALKREAEARELAAENARRAEAEARAVEESRRAAFVEEERKRADAVEEKRRKEAAAREEEEKRIADIAKKKADDDQRKVEEERLKALTTAATLALAGPGPSGVTVNAGAVIKPVNGELGAPRSLEKDAEYRALLARIKTTVRPQVQADRALRTWLAEKKMEVTRLVGQVTNSRDQVTRIRNKMLGIISAAQQRGSGAYEWMMDFTSKRIVSQAENEVAVKTARSKAFPLARICQTIFSKHPAFIPILISRIAKKCPFALPKYFVRIEGEAENDFKKRSRMKFDEDENIFEPVALYEERMCGILALYAALIQNLPGDAPNTFYDLGHGWTWLSRVLNLEPQRITPLLILTFLEIAGLELQRTFKSQFRKIWVLLERHLIPKMPEASISSLTLLTVAMTDWQRSRTGLIPAPPGLTLED